MAYAVHSNVSTTVFWVGEEGTPDSAFIPNYQSAWDGDWLRHYGGIDSLEHRAGDLPSLFAPKENPYYFALPYNDFDANGIRRADAASVVPWANTQVWAANESMLKNRWIKIEANGSTVYAQWEDVGPNNEHDINYVFGSSQPVNTFGAHAGLDVSPAVMNRLGVSDVFAASWQFVDFADVPAGPWTDHITTSQLTFNPRNEHPTGHADWLTGKPTAETINSLGGNDTVFGSGGDDHISGGGGNDRLFGGTGQDALDGGAGADIIAGESGNDVISGGAGADRLYGDAGRDQLYGGNGRDTIEGDGGADQLTGGAGRDVFVFRTISEIGKNAGGRDQVLDFEHRIDKIDLSLIDADRTAVGDQAFQYIGSRAFTGHAGELHKVLSGGTAIIEGDVNGDRHADFRLELSGLVALSKSDFIV